MRQADRVNAVLDRLRERAVRFGPAVEIDEIIAHTGIAPSKVFLAVLELDLAGRIERHSGNRVSIAPAAS